MLAKLEAGIPRGAGWTYEPKWDGFRTIVTAGPPDPARVSLVSRDARPMMRFFPEIVAMLAERPAPAFVADGEIRLHPRPALLRHPRQLFHLFETAEEVRVLHDDARRLIVERDRASGCEKDERAGAEPVVRGLRRPGR